MADGVSFPEVRSIAPLSRPVAGRVRPPGSKSLTNRALVAAALTRPGVSRLHGALEADDTMAMRAALGGFGVMVDDNDDPWLVLGSGGNLNTPSEVVEVGASGTTARFVTALAGLCRGETVIDGTARMRRRPMQPLVDALGAMGVEAVGGDMGGLPIRVRGHPPLQGGEVAVDASLSSQFASAVLMVAPMASEPVRVTLTGAVVSRPYLDGTVAMMRHFGADVTVDGDVFGVAPTGYRKASVSIEADASAAVYPAVAAAITGGRVTIEGIPGDSVQADLAILDWLARMGCSVTREETAVSVEGPMEGLTPIEADLTSAPDGAMALAVAALFADGVSRISGLSTLRHKETDRLTALETEFRRLGAPASVEGDALVVTPGRLEGTTIETYHDHRMAMSMALVGLVVPGLGVADPEVVTKTWPGYFEMLAGL